MLYIVLAWIYLLTAGSLYAAEYVAFSLKVAQQRITGSPGGQLARDVLNLGGITAVRGLVYDRKNADVILVGERDSERTTLTLDDFVVALRARFIHGKWPLVSIDPTEDTKKTPMQVVRFEGGIEETQFGEDLFDADYKLKRMGMGLLSPGIVGLKTHWDLHTEAAKQNPSARYNITSRFWFYPVLPSVSVRQDVVAIKGLQVGVFTEVLSAEIEGERVENPATFQDISGDKFAKAVSDNFERLARIHPSFSRVRGLDELVALSKAIEEMEERPNLSFWLKNYQVRNVRTKKEVKVLTREEEYQIPVADGFYITSLKVSGGVKLMALALRLKAGDVMALREAVLITRPGPDALSWSFVVGEWLIPTSPGMLRIDDVDELYTHALFLYDTKRYDDAIRFFDQIIEVKPDWETPYYARAQAYAAKQQWDKAMSDLDRTLEINPNSAELHVDRGLMRLRSSEYRLELSNKSEYESVIALSIADYERAITINPMLAEAYLKRASAYLLRDNLCGTNEFNLALPDISRALQINSKLSEAYNLRALIYLRIGFYNLAIDDVNRALELPVFYPETRFLSYAARGGAYALKGQLDKALSDFKKARGINPTLFEKRFPGILEELPLHETLIQEIWKLD